MEGSRELKPAAILRRLRTRYLGKALVILETCGSTNDSAAAYASDGAAHGFTVIAETQKTGRGRRGRLWASPRGGIWMTIILRGGLVYNAPDSLCLIGALAVARGLASCLGVDARVKWPNDVTVSDRKVSGVLVEAKSKGNELEYALLGIGINANFHASVVKDAAPASTTLLELLGHAIDRETLICTILAETEYLNDLLLSNESETLDLLQRADCSIGKRVRVSLQDKQIDGTFAGYDRLTKVRVATNAGTLVTIETSSVVSVKYPIE